MKHMNDRKGLEVGRIPVNDFDTIILLDACRFDYYTKFRKAELRLAPGNATQISIPKFFPGRYDRIYISANPYINSLGRVKPINYNPREHFLKVIDVWKDGWEAVDGVETVPPWNVTAEAAKWQRCGYKTIVHFMQPHAPYIGEIKLRVGGGYNVRASLLGLPKRERSKSKPDFDLVRKAYLSNLELVLRYAMQVVSGRTLITSDHGELLGVLGRTGHPTDVNHPKLREIPWEVIEWQKTR